MKSPTSRARCRECKTPLLEPSPSGYCGFCLVELGLKDPS